MGQLLQSWCVQLLPLYLCMLLAAAKTLGTATYETSSISMLN